MSIEVDILSDMWNTVKEYIPSKERQAVADHVINVVAEYSISDNDLKALGGTDSYMKRAVQEYLGGEEDEDNYDEEEDY